MYYLVNGSMAGNDGERWVRRLLCSLFGPVPFPDRPPNFSLFRPAVYAGRHTSAHHWEYSAGCTGVC